MNSTIHYLNTDLDLISPSDLQELARAFEAAGTSPLHVTREDEGFWHATFETDQQYAEPEPNISEMLTTIESLSEPLLYLWSTCTLREFNIGYHCGNDPWAFNQGISAALLRRLTNAGASIRFTLYPDRSGNVPPKST
ncbi:hypothetical protein [Gimesia panareensis]|uniref:hypothetical protein n=1 Tax=Gimesia panareensis TaxID=2527978 RepID=UPI00118976BF|nr:hypothetical protein [Gimesia panareensis]QDU49091.1 hypothetical protein Pan110_14090 [Gimesia panareensis]